MVKFMEPQHRIKPPKKKPVFFPEVTPNVVPVEIKSETKSPEEESKD
jgi:hypothetical protein